MAACTRLPDSRGGRHHHGTRTRARAAHTGTGLRREGASERATELTRELLLRSAQTEGPRAGRTAHGALSLHGRAMWIEDFDAIGASAVGTEPTECCLCMIYVRVEKREYIAEY